VLLFADKLILFSAIPEDAMKVESEDDDKVNPDERLPQSVTDKRIAPDNEFSDSEEEGDRKDQKAFKNRKRPRLDKSNKNDTEEKKANDDEEKKSSKLPTVFLGEFLS
jgi:histone deacetylase 1/2